MKNIVRAGLACLAFVLSNTLLAPAATAGQLTTLHQFTTSADGRFPYAGLEAIGSTLYGTTRAGGAANHGTIFKMNADGTSYQVLHDFSGAPTDKDIIQVSSPAIPCSTA